MSVEEGTVRMSARKMKDSDVAWLGEIPEGWQVYPLKYGFDFSKGLNITKADLTEKGVPVISYGQIHSKRNTGTHLSDELLRYVPCEFVQSDPAAVLQKNDFVFADTSEDLEGLGNCVFIDREDTVMAGYHAIVLRPSIDAEHKYLAYLFKTDCWRRQIRELAYGIKVYSLSQKILRRCSILLPPLPEQRRIAAYLDDRCARIDSVIETTKETIEDYKALKQSIIFEAVTGKNVGGKMKDSGVPWIGEIPEGWVMQQLRPLTVKIGSGKTPLGGANVYSDEGVMFLRSQNIYDDGIRVDDVSYINEEIDEEMASTRVFKGDVLLNITGGSIGRCCLYDFVEYANVNQHVCIIRTRTNILQPEYLRFFINGNSIDIVGSNQVGGNRQGLNFEQIGSIKLPLPRLAEQRQIVAALDKKCATIDSLIAEKLALIADLEAYKKSLIFESVTGKRVL